MQPPCSVDEMLARIERGRQKVELIQVVMGIVVMAAAVATALLRDHIWAMGVGFAGMVVLQLVVGWHKGFLTKDLRRVILPALVKEVSPALDYRLNGTMSQSAFVGSDMFMKPDRFEARHLVRGMVGDTAMRFGMVRTLARQGNRGHFYEIFTGVFAIVDFNKHFAGRALVRPAGAPLAGDVFGELVDLEDPHFKDEFTVNATDPVEVRYLLTPALMARFSALRAALGPFHASFDQGAMFLALPMAWEMFEVQTTVELDGPEGLAAMRTAMASIVGIVEELDLNTRIWTKAAAGGR